MTIGSANAGTNWFLLGAANLQQQEAKTVQEISSGYRIQTAADSPGQTAQLISLASSLATYQAYQTNLGRVQAEVNTADSALGSSISLIESATTLASEGASSTATGSQRQILATQVQSLQQQLVSIANTTTEGRYIFGGDQDASAPYQIDAASASGVDSLTSSTATRVFSNPSGEPIYQASTASTIFDPQTAAGAPAANNAFAALQTLSTALQANDTSGITNALTSLGSVSDWLNTQQASYGVASDRISQEQTGAANQITSLQTQISTIRDTDVTQAATDLSQENTAQSAAFGAQSEISHKSLFDYLG